MRALTDILREYLQQFKWRGDSPWAGALCPFPDHKDSSPSFRVNLEKGFFYCFGCQRSGSMAELLAVLGLPVADVDSLLSSIKFIKEIKKDNRTSLLPEYILAAFRRCPKSLLNAGFRKDVLRDNDIGFDLTYYAPTFPLRTKEGLLAAVYRRVQGDPKYLVYKFEDEFEDYDPAPKSHLWGLHKVYAKSLSGGAIGPLVVAEGFKACMWVQQCGYNAVATMGTGITKAQIGLLATLDVPTILMFDNNEAGDHGTVAAYKKLRGRLSDLRFCVYPRDKEQPDDLTKEEAIEALNDPKTFSEWSKTCLISQGDLAKRILGPAAKR